jgi:hypothetical protein
MIYGNDGTVNVSSPAWVSRLDVGTITQTYVTTNNKSTSARVNLTRASWSYRFIADRGW